jgi:hypothetical protein
MEAVILCAMARDPQHRFPSAETFGAALQDALAEPAGSARLQQFALARTVIASRAADPSVRPTHAAAGSLPTTARAR